MPKSHSLLSTLSVLCLMGLTGACVYLAHQRRDRTYLPDRRRRRYRRYQGTTNARRYHPLTPLSQYGEKLKPVTVTVSEGDREEEEKEEGAQQTVGVDHTVLSMVERLNIATIADQEMEWRNRDQGQQLEEPEDISILNGKLVEQLD